MKGFNCQGCGACCRAIGKAVRHARFFGTDGLPKDVMSDEYFQLAINFPYDFTEDGACVKLGESGLCTIYEDRPDLCRIDVMYKRFHRAVPREVFIKETENYCEILRNQEDENK